MSIKLSSCFNLSNEYNISDKIGSRTRSLYISSTVGVLIIVIEKSYISQSYKQIYTSTTQTYTKELGYTISSGQKIYKTIGDKTRSCGSSRLTRILDIGMMTRGIKVGIAL